MLFQVATLKGGKWDKMHDIAKRVYETNGIAPTLHTCGGGNLEPKILEEPLAYDEQNGYIRKDGTVGTLSTDGSSPPHNNRIVEPLTTRFSDVASTLRASMHKQGERNLIENIKNGRGYEGVIEPLVWDGFNQSVRKDSTTVGAITRNVGADLKRNGQGIIEKDKKYCRVRKFTENECFKLMGVKKDDFEKIKQNQSKSSCYHLAGDSIITTCLMALFGQMLNVDWREKVNEVVNTLIES